MALRAFNSNPKNAEKKIEDFFKNLPPDEKVVTDQYLNIPIGNLDKLTEFAAKIEIWRISTNTLKKKL